MRLFGGELVFRRLRLRLLELKLQLVKKPRRALGPRSINHAPQLLDLELKIRNQRTVVSRRGSSAGQFGADRRSLSARRNQRGFQRFDVVGNGGKIGVHESDGITKSDV